MRTFKFSSRSIRLLVVWNCWIAISAAELIRWTGPSTNSMRNLSDSLEVHRRNLGLPALAAGVVRGNQIVAAGAAGERKVGSGVRVTLADQFHMGSCTKSMTALLAAELVRQSKVDLNAPVGALFPEWDLEPDKSAISLTLLLQNRSGLGNNPSADLWSKAFTLKGSAADQRESFLREFLRQPLEAEPGKKFIYSNPGFALAGAMLEKRTGVPWETLMTNFLFQPLGLKSAGFGPPFLSGQTNQPWGHQFRDGALTAVEPSDNPTAIGPAGLVHLSVLDAARYAAFHCAVFNGDVTELKPFAKALYTPPEGSEYAMGWIVTQRSWAGGTALSHSGSNTMFFTLIWIAPAKNFAVVVMTNAGDAQGNSVFEKVDKVTATLIEQFAQ